MICAELISITLPVEGEGGLEARIAGTPLLFARIDGAPAVAAKIEAEIIIEGECQ